MLSFYGLLVMLPTTICGKCISHFSPQPLSPNLHSAEGEPFLAQVLQRGLDRIDGVVDVEEAVVGISEKTSIFVVLYLVFKKFCIFAVQFAPTLRRLNVTFWCVGQTQY